MSELVLNDSVFEAVELRTQQYVTDFIDNGRCNVLTQTSLDTSILPHFETFYKGKVRDMYICRDLVVLVTCDRQSAFDRHLTEIPYKGRILNTIAHWWFKQTQDIVPNHLLACPHPNVTIARRCEVFKVEFVMRAYATGSTNTSLWYNYHTKGLRSYCGHVLPDGLQKNQRLEKVLLTPTTKSDEHDALISKTEIVANGLMTIGEWELCEDYAHRLFAFGQAKALERGLILVDTKYEFGRDIQTGEICLVDEIHTPDSSRYWLAHNYETRFQQQQEPQHIDKEFLRLWYIQHAENVYDEKIALPVAPVSLINELSRRYVMLYEVITQQRFPDLLLTNNDNSNNTNDNNTNNNNNDTETNSVDASPENRSAKSQNEEISAALVRYFP